MAQKKTAFIINIGSNGYSAGQVEGITDNDTVILKNDRDTASYYGIPHCDTVESVDYEPEEDE